MKAHINGHPIPSYIQFQPTEIMQEMTEIRLNLTQRESRPEYCQATISA